MDKIDYPIIDPYRTVIIEWDKGFALTTFDSYLDSNEIRVERKFFSEVEEDLYGRGEPDFKSVADLLWEVIEALGTVNSKHFRKGIEIRVFDREKGEDFT
jgi:hypothetical protein